jgi:hypothetical protein
MRIFVCGFLLWSLALAAAAADVTGKWSGTFTATTDGGQARESGAVLIFKQNGTALTGSVGPDEDQQWEIASGKVDENKITVEAHGPNGGTARFELVLDGEHIKGDVSVSRADAADLRGKLDVTRAK